MLKKMVASIGSENTVWFDSGELKPSVSKIGECLKAINEADGFCEFIKDNNNKLKIGPRGVANDDDSDNCSIFDELENQAQLMPIPPEGYAFEIYNSHFQYDHESHTIRLNPKSHLINDQKSVYFTATRDNKKIHIYLTIDVKNSKIIAIQPKDDTEYSDERFFSWLFKAYNEDDTLLSDEVLSAPYLPVTYEDQFDADLAKAMALSYQEKYSRGSSSQVGITESKSCAMDDRKMPPEKR
jgi:hypothetical protein